MPAISDLIEQCEFNATGQCLAAELQTRPEVRDMCAADRCNRYDKSWSCPPACGSIEEFQQKISERKVCYIAQTWGELEDSFDYETMMELAKLHSERFVKLNTLVKAEFPSALVLGAGSCEVCKECTYPDNPCRFPDILMPSMEAAGLVVSDVCTSAGVQYNHGTNTIAYTGCVLL